MKNIFLKKSLIPGIAVFVLYLGFLALVQEKTYLVSIGLIVLGIVGISLIKSKNKIIGLLKILLEIIFIIVVTYMIYNKNITTLFSVSDYVTYYRESIAGAIVQVNQSSAPVAATSQINVILTLTAGFFAVLLVNIKKTIIQVLILIVPGIFATILSSNIGSSIAPVVTGIATILLLLTRYEFTRPYFIFRIFLLTGVATLAIIIPINEVNFPEKKENTIIAEPVGQVGLSDDPIVSLQRSLLSKNKNIILDYSGPRTYFKVATLDSFDGVRWFQSFNLEESVDTIVTENWGNQLKELRQSNYAKTRVRLYGLGKAKLPVPVDSRSIVMPQALGVDFILHNKNDNTYTIQGDGQNGPLNYIVGVPKSAGTKKTSDRPVTDNKAQKLNDKEQYLQVPQNVDPYIVEVAEDLTRDKDTSSEKIESIISWFKESGEFSYNIGVIGSYTQNPLLQFLQEKTGYCEQYAGASALLARLVGIPSRVVVGYTEGEKNSGGSRRIVYTSNAHAWIEVWLEGEGWVKYDPTPSDITDTDVIEVVPEENNDSTSAQGGRAESGGGQVGEVPTDPALELAEVLSGRSLENYELPSIGLENSPAEPSSNLSRTNLTPFYLIAAGVALFCIIFIFYQYTVKNRNEDSIKKCYITIQKKAKLPNATPHELGNFLKNKTQLEQTEIDNWVASTEKYLYYNGLPIAEKEYIKLSKNIIKSIPTNKRSAYKARSSKSTV